MKQDRYNFFKEHYPKEVEEAENILESNSEILKSIPSPDELRNMAENNEMLKQLSEDLIEKAYKYTEILFEFNEMISKSSSPDDREEAEEWAKLDEVRSISHNALIDSIIIFSRNLEKNEKDNTIFKKLGPKENRVAYGNFALWLTYKELLKMKNEEEQK